MFTSGQLCTIYIVTLLIVYCIISKTLDTIKHCSISKVYKKCLETGAITPNEFKNIMNIKEESEDGDNK